MSKIFIHWAIFLSLDLGVHCSDIENTTLPLPPKNKIKIYSTDLLTVASIDNVIKPCLELLNFDRKYFYRAKVVC